MAGYTTIQDLPGELLLDIFSYYISLVQESESSTRRPRTYLWIRITFVCQYWRRLCLDNCRLWNHIYALREECVREMLKRSKNTPLKTTIGWPWAVTEEDKAFFTEDELLRMMARQDEFIINENPAIIDMLAKELHRISELTVVGCGGRYLREHLPGSARWTHGILHLKNAGFDHHDTFFSRSVKHLEIITDDRPVSLIAPPFRLLNLMVLDKLIAMDLAFLKLIHVLPTKPLEPRLRQDSKLHHFHSLRSLTIYDGVKNITNFLDYITFGYATRVHLSISGHCSPDRFVRLAEVIERRLSADAGAGFPLSASVSVDVPLTWYGAEFRTCLRGWRDVKDVDDLDITEDLEDLQLMRQSSDGWTNKIIQLVFPRVEALAVRFGQYQGRAATALRFASEVVSLKISGWTARPVREVLMPHKTTLLPSYPFPRLHTLILTEPMISLIDDMKDDILQIAIFLKERSVACGKLSLIELRFHIAEPVVLEKFRECAHEVRYSAY